MNLSKKFSQRGEITAVLTLLGLGAVIVGTFLGSLLVRKGPIKTQTKAAVINCQDSDGGQVYTQKGTLSYTDPKDGLRHELVDFCQSEAGPTLQEWYCLSSTEARGETKTCTTMGFLRCEDGACIGGAAGLPTPSPLPTSPGGNPTPLPSPTPAGPGTTTGIDSVQIVSLNSAGGTFNINFCLGTFVSGLREAKYFVDGPIVATKTYPTTTFYAPGSQCQTLDARVTFNDAYRSNRCPGSTLNANVVLANGNGTYQKLFSIPHVEDGVCVSPTATPGPTNTPPPGATNTPVPPTSTPPPGATATPVPTTPPGAPTPTCPLVSGPQALNAPVNGSNVTLSWGAVADASRYVLELMKTDRDLETIHSVCANQTTSSCVDDHTLTTTSRTITLENGTYHWRVWTKKDMAGRTDACTGGPTAGPNFTISQAPSGQTIQLDIYNRTNTGLCHSAWVNGCDGSGINTNNSTSGSCRETTTGSVKYTNDTGGNIEVACAKYSCNECRSTAGVNQPGVAQCQNNWSSVRTFQAVPSGCSVTCTESGMSDPSCGGGQPPTNTPQPQPPTATPRPPTATPRPPTPTTGPGAPSGPAPTTPPPGLPATCPSETTCLNDLNCSERDRRGQAQNCQGYVGDPYGYAVCCVNSPTATPQCNTGNCYNDCICRGNTPTECQATCRPNSGSCSSSIDITGAECMLVTDQCNSGYRCQLDGDGDVSNGCNAICVPVVSPAGIRPADPAADLNADRTVNSRDFILCLRDYQAVCNATKLSKILNNLGRKY